MHQAGVMQRELAWRGSSGYELHHHINKDQERQAQVAALWVKPIYVLRIPA